MTAWVVLVLGAILVAPVSARGRLLPRPFRPPTLWRARSPGRTPEQIVEVLTGLRDELRAGAGLRVAFERAAESTGARVCPQAVAVCRMGGAVPEALRADARGEPLLNSLAALWEVCEGSGGALASALDRLIAGARQSAKLRREVRAQLAGPRATMKVLAALPLVGVGMGVLMGANPVAFLVGTVWGWGCLLTAGALEAGGVLWMRRIVRRIEARL